MKRKFRKKKTLQSRNINKAGIFLKNNKFVKQYESLARRYDLSKQGELKIFNLRLFQKYIVKFLFKHLFLYLYEI